MLGGVNPSFTFCSRLRSTSGVVFVLRGLVKMARLTQAFAVTVVRTFTVTLARDCTGPVAGNDDHGRG